MNDTTTQDPNAQTDRSCWLRGALLANGLFSAASAIAIVAMARPLASWLGHVKPGDLAGLAISLLIFAATLFWTAKSKAISRNRAWIFVWMDVAWVLGSLAVIFTGVLTTRGNWIVGVVADIVLLFALGQFIGIRKLRPSVR